MSKPLELEGKRFGRLVVLERSGSDKQRNIVWKCQCDCGNIHYVKGALLKRGAVTSCGCKQKEACMHVVELGTKHGLSHHPLYQIWKSMRKRCNCKTEKSYPNYGGRGITICSEWDDYAVFHKWALDNGWHKGVSIDRIDNDKGYSPENCRMATNKMQMRNRRKTVYLEYNGEKRPLSEWCEIYGLNMKTCYGRLHDYGWNNPKEILFGRGIKT